MLAATPARCFLMDSTLLPFAKEYTYLSLTELLRIALSDERV